ncbi:helix-turn-helix domain-containing protein [Miltoncostaea oceani]|uniref:helix-turn-helix domain-containing protein n=1 Tax=Miltoncostaea oceani TaxID=2843216 RepID=UPI001C3D7988|nr:helix-turn-helix domain-containing protein [Miltoncostaea oceani]
MRHLTTREAAALLGVSSNSVRAYADAGFLRCSRTARGDRRFLEADVLAYLASRQAQEKPFAEVRAELWTKTILSVLRAAERDLGGSSSQSARFAAARELIVNSSGVRPAS